MRHILALLALLAIAPFAGAQSFDHEHKQLTTLLERHVQGDRVDYRALGKERAQLGTYLKGLERVQNSDFQKWTREQRFAFWINAYNAYTLELILEEYPLKSIKDIGGLFSAGPWERRFIELQHLAPDLGKKKLNLESIEHKILRPVYKDARLHAAVNCASIGCPPLRKEAYVASKLEEQLAEQTKLWLADSSRNQFDEAKKRVRLSKIFDWFDDDFGGKDAKVLQWLQTHAPKDKVAWLDGASGVRITYLSYDWKLNDVQR